MRWRFVKEAMLLARKAFGREDVWVEAPPRLDPQGEAAVYAGDLEKPIGKVSYLFKPVGTRLKLELAANGERASVDLPPRRTMSFKVAAGPGEVPESAPGMRAVLERYGEAAPPLLATIAWSSMGRPLTEDEARGMLSEVPAAAGEVMERLEAMGALARPNVRLAKGSERFKRGDRVRVVGPCMEYGELGWVMEKPREDKKRNKLYMVLVDGSSEPREFAADWLAPNAAGRVPEERPR